MSLPDYDGPVEFEYAPSPNGMPDPGEIVWTWVPFEDDPTQGKDRPVLIIGEQGHYLLGLMLTSKDHDRDAAVRREGATFDRALFDEVVVAVRTLRKIV